MKFARLKHLLGLGLVALGSWTLADDEEGEDPTIGFAMILSGSALIGSAIFTAMDEN